MRFNDAGKFNTKAFNSDRLFTFPDLEATVKIKEGEATFPLEGWDHRKSITINNTGDTLTNHPIKFTIHRGIGVDSGEDVYVGSSGCEEDYDDIRFTQSDAETLLDYWIEESNSDSATIWVEINSIIGSDDTTLYLYYGNSDASPVSDGSATFSFFDDFDTLNLDTVWERVNSSGTCYVSDSTLTLFGEHLKTQSAVFSIDQILEGCVKFAADSGSSSGTCFFGGRLDTKYCDVRHYYNKLWCDRNDGSERLLTRTGSLVDFEVVSIERASTTAVNFYYNYGYDEQDTWYEPTGDIGISIYSPNQTKEIWVKWVRIRKYVATEPTITDWGEETDNIANGCEFEFILTQETTITNAPAATLDCWTFPDLEETISNDAELTHSIFVNTTPIFTIDFDSGSSEITVGETVTGATSGATGTVLAVELSSGSWEGGDAAGTIQIQGMDGLFEDGEELDGSVAGDSAATADGEATRVTSKIYDKSVWKGIDDAYWSASVLLHGYFSFTENANFRELMITMKDHNSTDQTVFYGYIPDQGLTYDKNEYTTKLDAYSHARNLVDQYIPEADRNTVKWDSENETTSFYGPDETVTTLLGGLDWNAITGVKPRSIVPVSDWGAITTPERGWVWGPETTRWQAIIEMCDYLGYMFDVVYDSTNDWQAGIFCAVDDIDTYYGTPDAVTFTKTDTPKYVMSVKKEKRGTEKINRVRVQGKRNKRKLNFVSGSKEFTAEYTVTEGGSDAEATIVSCTKTSGDWNTGTAVGYLIISYDRTADFRDGYTIIDKRGAEYGAAVMNGNSLVYEQYDMYEYSVEDTDVGYSDGNRPRERFFDLEEEYDSTSLIQAKAQAYYDLFSLDATPYTVVFRDRCDLRLWQKVKLVGWSDVSEDWMRIVYIKYTETNAGNVIVTVTLNNSDYVMGQRKMRRSLRNDDVNEIETIIKTWLKKNTAQVADTLKVEGEGITVQFEPGGVNFIVRNPGG